MAEAEDGREGHGLPMAVAGPGTDLLPEVDVRAASLLALLTLAAAVTEGAGVILMVPMLAALQGDGAALPGFVRRLGVPLDLPPLLALFVALVVVRGGVATARDLASLRFEARLVDGLRRRAWDALLRCDWRRISAMRQSDIQSLLVSNIDRVGYGVNQLVALCVNGATLMALGLAALAIAPVVVIAAALGGGAVLAAHRGLRSRARVHGAATGRAYDAVHAALHDALGALRIVKSYNREDRARQDLFSAITALRRAELAFARDNGLARIALHGGGAALLAGLVWLAVARWHVPAAALLPLVALFARALPLLGSVQDALQNWAHARPALEATSAFLQDAGSSAEDDGSKDMPVTAPVRELVLEGVTIWHAGRGAPALHEVSLSLPVGSTTVLTGPSGAGKSTAADVLGGLIAPDSGQLLLDGAALRPGQRRA